MVICFFIGFTKVIFFFGLQVYNNCSKCFILAPFIMAEHNETGKKGEELATGMLKDKGYEILEKNWRYKNLEADIIAKKDDTLIIAEVKTRSTRYFGEPEEFVNKAKKQNLIKAANAYIEQQELDLEVRFDIISVLISGEKTMVHHIEDAFYPTA